MPYLLVVYGAAFFAGGFALTLQARSADDAQPLPRIALALLAGFALAHGVSEWTALGIVLDLRAHVAPPARLVVSGLLLLAVSFALLFAFGSALLVRSRYRVAHVAAGGLVPLALCVVLVERFLEAAPGSLASNRAALEAIVRYALGIPACLAAALGLLALRRSIPAEETRTLQYVVLASGVLLCYGVLAGVVVPRAPFAPASFVNASAFRHNVHLPVEVLRAACAVAIVLFMSEAFVIEPFHRLRRDLGQVRGDLRALLAFDVHEPLRAAEQGCRALETMAPADRASERGRATARAIRDCVRLIGERIADRVDVSELQGSSLTLTCEAVDLGPVLLRAAERNARSARAGSIPVHRAERLPMVLADPARLERVVGVLVASAFTHAPASGMSDVVLRAEQRGDVVAVSVTSRGAGLAPHRLPFVFSRQVSGRDDERGRPAPSGDGLYLARGLVEAMGGEMMVESEPDVALTFRFTLPVAPPRSAELPLPGRAE